MKSLKFRMWDGESMSHSTLQELINHQTNLKNKRIMQFTGLHDKRGKEIYEGDIVRDGSELMVMKYRTPSFVLMHREPFMPTHDSNTSDWELWPTWPSKIEIVGNIFEDEKLLQDK